VGNAFQGSNAGIRHDFGHEKQDWAYSILLGAMPAERQLVVSAGRHRPAKGERTQRGDLFDPLVSGDRRFAASTNYVLAVALLFLRGLLNLTFLSMAQTLVQLQAPTQLRGRLIGLFNMSNNGLRAFSGVTVGVVGGLIGVH